MNELQKDVSKILVEENEIKEICNRLGQQISKDYAGKKPLVVGVLKGSVVFIADLIRNITCDC